MSRTRAIIHFVPSSPVTPYCPRANCSIIGESWLENYPLWNRWQMINIFLGIYTHDFESLSRVRDSLRNSLIIALVQILINRIVTLRLSNSSNHVLFIQRSPSLPRTLFIEQEHCSNPGCNICNSRNKGVYCQQYNQLYGYNFHPDRTSV